MVALALGLHVAGVEIVDENNSGDTSVTPIDHLSLVDQVAICVAGINASKMFKAPIHEGAGRGDHAKLIELFKGIDEVTACELRQNGHQRAWDLLTDHTGTVETIAARLLAERKIDLTGYVLSP